MMTRFTSPSVCAESNVADTLPGAPHALCTGDVVSAAAVLAVRSCAPSLGCEDGAQAVAADTPSRAMPARRPPLHRVHRDERTSRASIVPRVVFVSMRPLLGATRAVTPLSHPPSHRRDPPVDQDAV